MNRRLALPLPLALGLALALAACGKGSAPDVAATASAAATLAAAAPTAPATTDGNSEDIATPFGSVRIEGVDIPDAAHVDAGRLKVTYLDSKPPKVFAKAVEVGSFGEMSAWQVDERFTDYPVIVSEGGGTWQGQTCSWTVLTELRPSGPVEIANIETAADDSGVSPDKPTAIEGKLGDVVKNTSFTVTFTGTRAFTAHYKRTGVFYKLIDGPDHALSFC